MRTSVSLVICFLLAGAARAQDLNVISGVEVKDEGPTVRITVKGSKAPNFTTFPMTDPPRFVIDFSEARLQGVPEEVRGDNGLVTLVKNLAYGTGASSIARVMLAFTADVEPPDVRIDGSNLVVSVMRPAGMAAPAVAAAAVDDGRARAEADERARQEALDREQADREARAQAEAQAQRTREEREAQARAEADARARAEAAAREQQAREEEAARLAADARRAAIAARVAAESAAPAPAAPSAPAPAEAAPAAAAVVPPAAVAETARPAAVTAPAAPLAVPDASAQAKADERAERKARKAVEAELARQQGAPATPPRVAAVPAPPPATPLPPAHPGKLDAIGFQQLPTVSRVFVRTSTPPHYTISDVGDDVVRVELENTRSPRRNDTRPLDTSFFPSAVAMITPSRQGTSYVVDIRLRQRVPYQQKLEGDVLAIDFERPAVPPGAAGAAPPEGSAPAPRAGKKTESSLENEHGLIVAPEGPETPAAEAPAAEPTPAEAVPPAPKQ